MTNEELVLCIQEGMNISENMLELWQQNRKFIHMIAKRFNGKAEIEDLEQEGYLALYAAVDGYKPEYGYKFLTYAERCIKQYMIRYIRHNAAAHIPEAIENRLREYKKLVNSFSLCYGRKPTNSEIAHCLGITIEKLDDIYRAERMHQAGSLDSPLSEEESATVGDMVVGDADVEADIIQDVQNRQLKEILWPLVDALPDKQGEVLRNRYQKRKTLKETGNDIGASVEQVRHIEAKALYQLRHSRKSKILRTFSDDAIYSMAMHGTSYERFNATWISSTEAVAMQIY